MRELRWPFIGIPFHRSLESFSSVQYLSRSSYTRLPYELYKLRDKKFQCIMSAITVTLILQLLNWIRFFISSSIFNVLSIFLRKKFNWVFDLKDNIIIRRRANMPNSKFEKFRQNVNVTILFVIVKSQ